MKRYAIVPTKQYRKDFKQLLKSHADIRELETAIDLLASGELPARYRDHALRGALRDTRECHIGPDWILRYAKDDDLLILLLISTGHHRHVLGVE